MVISEAIKQLDLMIIVDPAELFDSTLFCYSYFEIGILKNCPERNQKIKDNNEIVIMRCWRTFTKPSAEVGNWSKAHTDFSFHARIFLFLKRKFLNPRRS